ncbi:MAG: cell wall-binding repeat-containing protein [Bacillota bacterium]|nr:cell wall-binding repeat-containing protein [Bacillota bacterium]
MLKKRIIASTLSLLLLSPLAQISNTLNVQATTETPVKSITRVQGTNRFKTSVEIAKKVFSDDITLDNVVLTSGYDFPDGLSGSTLAKKLNAPILMAGNLSDSQDALNYIYAHLKQNGNVYILGGIGVVSKDTEDTLNNKGYIVTRLSGKDRIETNDSIVNFLGTPTETPVFIASANSFPDALSVSSIAAINGYPILLTEVNSLSSSIKDDLSKIKPSTVYIVGGTGVVSSDVESSIKTLLPSSSVQRISGANRFETSMDVFTTFSSSLNTANVVLSSGLDFPDALCGSQLAAKLNASIVLADENNLDTQQVEYNIKGITNFYILGGTSAVSDNVEEAINSNENEEMANIRNVLTTFYTGLNQKDINKAMSVIHEYNPYYDSMKQAIQNSFNKDNSDNISEIYTDESFTIVSITDSVAIINYIEKRISTNNNTGLTDSQTYNIHATLYKINGKWYIDDLNQIE